MSNTATLNPVVRDAIRDAGPVALVDAVIQLTHRIHSYDDCIEATTSRSVREHYQAKADEARAQRDLAKAEIVRRATR